MPRLCCADVAANSECYKNVYKLSSLPCTPGILLGVGSVVVGISVAVNVPKIIITYSCTKPYQQYYRITK